MDGELHQIERSQPCEIDGSVESSRGAKASPYCWSESGYCCCKTAPSCFRDRVEGEEMSGGIVKYFEMDRYGRKLNRVLYAFSGNELPDPVDGADWRLDMAFDRGTEILSAPQLKEVFERVLKNGFEIVTHVGELGLKEK